MTRHEKEADMSRMYQTGKRKNDLWQGIICAVCAVACCFNFRQMFIFALMFAACAVFRFFHYAKLKKQEEAAQRLRDEYDDEDEESKPTQGKIPRKERKKRYNEFLDSLEEELGDFDDEQDEDDG